MAITFFKTPKNKQFGYKPVYYDARKEALKKLSRSAYSEAQEENTDYEKALRDRMNLRWKRTAHSKSRTAARGRLLIILVILFLLVYIVFFTL